MVYFVSVLFGWLATVIPRTYTYYISTALFAFFGLKMLYEGYHMSPNEAQEEIEEVQSDLRKREDEVNRPCQKFFTTRSLFNFVIYLFCYSSSGCNCVVTIFTKEINWPFFKVLCFVNLILNNYISCLAYHMMVLI